MPGLIIDEREIEVPAGTKVIEAAERLGIMIPRFCYHPALGSVGACRLCAVMFQQGPVKGVQMSCMVDARDGMVVSTTDEEAVDFRRHVIEWLMLNHPHDCPVCDEGGHCLLQDMTVSGGHGLRRYLGNKRTHRDQYLGPLVQHEMNRCIQCYRCTRYYQEFCGYRDLGVMQNANRVYFGRYQEGILESPFSGNLIDICPTGVFTDKPSRFTGRRWDYERSPSVCIHCSLGCATTASVRYRRLVRQEARFSSAVNGYFICDRGRYGFDYNDRPDRPRLGRMNAKEVPGSDALREIAGELDKITRSSGPEAIACLGSGRSSVETLAMLGHLCRIRGWPAPAFWPEAAQAVKVGAAVARLEPELAVSLREIEKADFILAAGVDPLNEAPMLALALRQAQRRGAGIVVIDPRPVRLPFDFSHLPVPAAALDSYAGLLLKLALRDAAAGMEPKARAFLEALPDTDLLPPVIIAAAPLLQQSRRPVIICGTDAVSETLPALAADGALLLQSAGKPAGLFYVLPAANAFGAALLSRNGHTLEQILAGIESGKIKALLLVESDPLRLFPDRRRLEGALEKLDLLAALDYRSSLSARRADIFVATATVFEAGGIFINQEGRVQQIPAAYRGGVAVAQISAGSHPPRVFQEKIPGGNIPPAWLALAALAQTADGPVAPADSAGLQALLQESHPVFAGLPSPEAFPKEGVRLLPAGNFAAAFAARPAGVLASSRPPDAAMELLLVERTFGTEELSAEAAPLLPLQPAPCLFIQSADAQRLGFIDGDAVTIQTEQGALSVQLSVQDRMAAGVLVLPRQEGLPWQIFKAGQRWLFADQIRKADAG